MTEYKRLDGFYIKKNEDFLLKFMIPDFFIRQNLDKDVEADYLLKFLQDELNSILNSFVNGGFSRKGFILYPLMKDVSRENMQKIKFLEKIAYALSEKGFDFSDSLLKYRHGINKNNFTEILSALYSDLSNIKLKGGGKSQIKPRCKEFDINEYKKEDQKYLDPLNGLKAYVSKHLKEYLSGFYLHGSFATKDYIKGWSDVDTLAIISKETTKSPKNLIKLRTKMYLIRRFFYQMDPLQHHGSIIISEYDLQNYCQAYFPLQVLKYANSLFPNDKESKFLARNYEVEAVSHMFWFVNYFRTIKIEKRYNLGSYDFKNLLHSITLFPSLYLQAKETIVYKKFSFSLTRKDFDRRIWGVMDEVSSIRKNWGKFTRLPFVNSASKINPLFSYQLNSRLVDLFKNKNIIENTKKIIESMYLLSEEAWDKVKENARKKL